MGSTSDRLPSFKGPRDLSLSSQGNRREQGAPSSSQARPRRVFTPNIPPKRDKGSGSGTGAASSSCHSSSRDSSSRPPSGNARGRGRGGQRGAGRGARLKGDLVQSESIFSDGIGDPMEAKRSSLSQYKGGYSSRYKSASDGGPSRVSSMNRSTLKTIIKEENSTETDKKLFGSDKGDVEEEEDTEPSNPNLPVVLPLFNCDYASEFFMEPSVLTLEPEKAVSESTTSSTEPQVIKKIKQEKSDEDVATTTLVIKQEKLDTTDDPVDDKVKQLASIPLEPTSFAGTFRTTPPEGTLMYFQLPDELPVLEGSVKDSVDPSSNTALVQDINELPEGLIGKFQILSTGRTRFVLGENFFDVDPGRPVGFRQELHSVDTENRTITNLGSVERKFLIMPDIEYLAGESLFQ